MVSSLDRKGDGNAGGGRFAVTEITRIGMTISPAYGRSTWIRDRLPRPQGMIVAKWTFTKRTLTHMDNRFVRSALPALACLSLLLAGCGGLNLWPFGGEKDQDRIGAPADATEYQCAGGKHFYVRYLDNGGAAWVIFPEREFRLDKVAAAAGTRYSNRVATLEVNGNEATLADGPAISFIGCKATGK